MPTFFSGMVAMGFLVAGLFFLRFWRRTGDMLFAAFAVAFFLFALQQWIVGVSDIPREELSWTFLLRLAGFALLIVAILVKNLGQRTEAK
jgi:zinc transporter ZupT